MSQEKFINKVQKLLALASDPGAPEAERNSAQDKADAMILTHQIDRAMLGKNGGMVAEGITTTEWSIPYTEYSAQVNGLLGAVMQHCKIRMGWATYMRLTVVGYESDIAYAEMLWAILYREFAGNLWPKWKTEATFDANVHAHVRGGYKWEAIAKAANNHGVEVKWPDNGRLKRAYHRECKARGEQITAHTSRHSAFRSSYAMSFQATITARLKEMRSRVEQDVVVDADRYAVAVRSNAQKVQDEFYRLFPQHDPKVQAAQTAAARQAEAERRAAMTQAQRDAEDERLRKQEAKDTKWFNESRDKQYDRNGWSQGNRVARDVDLSMGKGHITPNRTELNR